MMNPTNQSAMAIGDKHEDVLDGAHLVKCDQELMAMAVWHGGVTINIYGLETLEPRTCFTLSDEIDEPEDRETVEEHVEELFEREKESLYDFQEE